MNKKPLCFISHAHVDSQFIYNHIIPVLKSLGVDYWVAGEQVLPGQMIYDSLIEGIKKSDFILTVVNSRSSYVQFEIGAAIGNNKPILAIQNDKYPFSPFQNHLNILQFNNDNFSEELNISIRKLLTNVIDKSNFKTYSNKKIVGIQVGTYYNNFELEVNFTSDFLSLIKLLTESAETELLQTAKGSLKSLISLDLKSWAELLEKIIFMIPELKKRKAERFKVQAETDKLKAETRKIDLETNIRNAEAFLDLFEKYEKSGIKIQIDDDLLITQNESGNLSIKKPLEK